MATTAKLNMAQKRIAQLEGTIGEQAVAALHLADELLARTHVSVSLLNDLQGVIQAAEQELDYGDE